MAKTLLIILCLSRFVVVVNSQVYLGPPLVNGLGALSGGAGYYMLEGIILPTGTVKGLDYYVDRSLQWSPFTLIIFRPIGDSATTTQYRIIGTYSVTVEPSVVNGITGQNISSAEYIDVIARDQIAFYSNLQHISVTAQFDANSNLSTRFSAHLPSNPVPAVGDSITFERVGLGPTFYSLRVLVEESTNTVTTCQGGGFSVCDQLCTDDVTGYYCSCGAFYQLDPADNATCVPIQRTCTNIGNSYCSHNCTDTSTSFVCSCRPGFTLQSNGYSCVENDLSAFIGEQGRTGLKGERGLQGSRGQQGIVGATGPTGPQGQTGLQGVKGVQGTTGPVGSKGSVGTNGIKGDPGQQGLKGEKGSFGSTGVTGPVGLIGITGSTGLPGINGLNGALGQKGLKGDTGVTGPSGTKGMPGLQGTPGQTGETGEKGNSGPKGDSGIKGVMGDTGPMGATGLQGPIFQDVDECLTKNICDHNCVNTIGSFYCTCNAGYSLKDNSTCIESLECSVQNGGCQHKCTERTGGYVCSCYSGYDLGPDRHSCIDKNECSNMTKGGCSLNNVCINTPGGSMCVPVDNAATCSRAASQRQNECEYSSGLVSGNTIIGFIVWLVILTILVLGILGCVLCINDNKRGYINSGYDKSRRSSEIWEDKSGTNPTRFSSIRTRLPESNYTYY